MPVQTSHAPGSSCCNTATAILSATGLRKTYGGRAVVDGVSLTVQPGEIVGLMGPNGAGKTTSFYMIAGLVPPDAGSVHFNGADISSLPMHRRARLGLGYLPQEESVFRKLSVLDNLLAILETRPNLGRKERFDRANDLLERFGIAKLSKSLAITLSGGEKRRLAIARALCTDPKLLMLDEPFAGIDPIAVEDIQKIVRDLRERDGLAILITDHSVRETLSIADRAFLIHDGRVILEGASEELVNDPVAKKYYLGEDFKM
ncbi:LPS export ABC transporter ATP-binding protein [Luteolibacter ambystomatis]|uniref:LPS export ABC transporter ATP-binding protein n=1 Tax=Luteolibacter ambystomatis TaxID=2824561 RepID=A0A975G8H8_9BACT|nr:LPS export ABC transporter ATP-binding protein [Luteolibacter ambystomatis]QUE50753.1 LPS export ABC transporter ATP-binding protein [Luteolibacter ambystomatis]